MSFLFIPAIIFVIDVFLGAVHLSRHVSRGGRESVNLSLYFEYFEHFLDRSLI